MTPPSRPSAAEPLVVQDWTARRTMTLEQAQALYEPDWYASYVRLGRPGGSNGD